MKKMEIQLHKCLGCDTQIPQEDDTCEECGAVIETDLAIHEVLVAMGRVRTAPINALEKRIELLRAVKNQIQDIEEEIEVKGK